MDEALGSVPSSAKFCWRQVLRIEPTASKNRGLWYSSLPSSRKDTSLPVRRRTCICYRTGGPCWLFVCLGSRDRTQDFVLAREMLYHWAKFLALHRWALTHCPQWKKPVTQDHISHDFVYNSQKYPRDRSILVVHFFFFNDTRSLCAVQAKFELTV